MKSFILIFTLLAFFTTVTAIPSASDIYSFLTDNSTVALFTASATDEKAKAAAPVVVSRTLSFLRGADQQTLELCVAAPESCPDDLRRELEQYSEQKGLPMIADVLLVNFCMHSPLASSLEFCADRDAKAMLSHLYRHKDNTYTNEPLLACVRDEPSCDPNTRTHLENTLLEPEVMNPIQQLITFVCRDATYKDQMATCAVSSGLVQWKLKKLSPRAKKLPAINLFQTLRAIDVVQLAHCAADRRLCPVEVASKLDDLKQHKGMIEVSDATIVALCKYSPFAHKFIICRQHDSDMMVKALQVYKDKEYGNGKIVDCVKGGLDAEHCHPVALAHLTDLMQKPDMLVPVQHMLKFFCQSDLHDSLATCTEPRAQPETLAKLSGYEYSVILDRARQALTM